MEVNSMSELYEKLAEAHGKLTVVYFYFSYCGSCLRVLPKWSKLISEHQDVNFLKVEVKDVAKAVDTFELTQVPTFVALLRQEEINRYVGSKGGELKKFVEKSIEECKAKSQNTEVALKQSEILETDPNIALPAAAKKE